MDDYGIAGHDTAQRRIAIANADYIATGDISELSQQTDPAYRYYGVAFDMSLLLVERSLGLQDSRPTYLMRHLITHLFFIAGGFVCGVLAYRMLGNRWIALLAMLLFLLHPRLYAHSFFNVKDIPFAALLLIALYLAHRAFRRDTLGAFLLCGIGVGLAINLRPFALMLPPMILAMRALDLWQASKAERKRILMTGAAFAIAALATMYITHPYYWENPLRFVEGARVLSQHANDGSSLFMGVTYTSVAAPWNYIPVWFAITAPPLALPLGALGAAAVCWQAATRPLAALRDREIRFRIMLLACFVTPVVAVIALQASAYNGWRHMYFLWAPFCLLAAVGLHTIANVGMQQGIWKIGAPLPGWVRGGRRLHMARRPLAYGVAGVGLLTTLTAMAALHPNQQVYFNALTDTKTPGALGERYDMDYYRMAQRQSLEYLLARYPNDTLRALRVAPSLWILPQKDRERIISLRSPHSTDFYLFGDEGYNRRFKRFIDDTQDPRYYLHPLVNALDIPEGPPSHSVRAYGSDIALIYGKDAAAYHAAYADVAANGDPLARADFDIYSYDGALYYLSADCPPPSPNRDALRIFLHIIPEDPADLPAASREQGFENRDFRLSNHAAAFFDGKCIHRQPLPEYSIARIATGAHMKGKAIWREDINMAARATARAVYDSIAAGDYGAPVAQSRFDLYISDNALTYLKEPCSPGDAHARFFLHIFPADPSDLPTERREFGFENLGFQFADQGADIVGKCVAERELPNYHIARIRTGQIATARGGDEWRADIDLAARAAAQALYHSIAAGDYGQPAAQSDFDVYLRGNALTYLKEPCVPGDADARFFLHITPADTADLPADRRARGFDNLDFWFAEHGSYAGDICVAERELPDYPIERIRTGQFVSGEGAIWRTEFAAGR